MSDFKFKGEERLIEVEDGVEVLDVQDLYSRYKDWVLEGNSQWVNAMVPIGGQPIGSGQFISPYIQLVNGWRIKPFEGNHVLTVLGNIITDDEEDPFLSTTGNFNVSIRAQVSSNSLQARTLGQNTAQEVWNYDLETHDDLETSTGNILKNQVLKFRDWFTLRKSD